MLRLLPLSAALSAVLIPFVAEIAQSRPMSEVSPYSVVLPSDIDKPVCYMQTEEGKTLDLTNICIKPPEKFDRDTQEKNQEKNQENIPQPGLSDLPENLSPM